MQTVQYTQLLPNPLLVLFKGMTTWAICFGTFVSAYNLVNSYAFAISDIFICNNMFQISIVSRGGKSPFLYVIYSTLYVSPRYTVFAIRVIYAFRCCTCCFGEETESESDLHNLINTYQSTFFKCKHPNLSKSKRESLKNENRDRECRQ